MIWYWWAVAYLMAGAGAFLGAMEKATRRTREIAGRMSDYEVTLRVKRALRESFWKGLFWPVTITALAFTEPPKWLTAAYVRRATPRQEDKA